MLTLAAITGSIAQAYEEACDYGEALQLYRRVLALEEGRPEDQCETLSHIVGRIWPLIKIAYLDPVGFGSFCPTLTWYLDLLVFS